jgi:hypothetical protein
MAVVGGKVLFYNAACFEWEMMFSWYCCFLLASGAFNRGMPVSQSNAAVANAVSRCSVQPLEVWWLHSPRCFLVGRTHNSVKWLCRSES